MSRGFSIAHSQVTPGLDARSHQVSNGSLNESLAKPGGIIVGGGERNES